MLFRSHVIAKKDPDAAPVLEVERDSHVGMLATIVTLVAIGAVLAALLPTQAARQEVNDSIGSQPNYSNQAIASPPAVSVSQTICTPLMGGGSAPKRRRTTASNRPNR